MMEKELERAGIPTVQICTIIPIAETVGANRIEKAVAIPYPIGNPSLAPAEEHQMRKELLLRALKKLTQKID